jgi:hypothetical protein
VWNNFYGAFLTDPPEQRTPEFLFNQVACTTSELVVEIDGVPVGNPERFHVRAQRSGLFKIQLPETMSSALSSRWRPSCGSARAPSRGITCSCVRCVGGAHTIYWRARGTCFGQEQVQEVTYVTVLPHPGQ